MKIRTRAFLYFLNCLIFLLAAVPLKAADQPTLIAYFDLTLLRYMPSLKVGHDPFYMKTGLVHSLPPSRPLKIEAVIMSSDKRVALINGQVVTVGTQLGEGQIVKEIGPDYVLIEENGHVRDVHIRSPALDDKTKK